MRQKIVSFFIIATGLILSASAHAQFEVGPIDNGRWNPAPINSTGFCTADLQDSSGGIHRVFRAQFCQEAIQQCENELYWMKQQGFDPYGRCVISSQGPGAPYPGPGPGPSPFPPQERIVDEVHFYHHHTARAIQMCEEQRQRDFRCNGARDQRCSPCSRIDHSDHSSYLVYQLIYGGGGRQLLNTYYYNHSQPGMAYRICINERMRFRECSMSQFECTPCTQDPYQMHSEFSLYQLY